MNPHTHPPEMRRTEKHTVEKRKSRTPAPEKHSLETGAFEMRLSFFS
jgi:hypothetical protein